jgi:CRISPR-associated protein Csb3
VTGSDQASVQVDLLNPGQVFACCGLLELASRLWKGVEGRFEMNATCRFVLTASDSEPQIAALLQELAKTNIVGLTKHEVDELKRLQRTKKETGRLSESDEQRRKKLEKQEREGSVILAEPFNLTLDWWQEDGTPTTWAGQQRVGSIARAAQSRLPGAADVSQLLNYACVLRSTETDKKPSKKVEPFYFDARRFAGSLDVGFSLDEVGGSVVAYPAVELLCLIGLQRFRPAPTEDRRYRYRIWSDPLGVCVAAGAVSGAVPVPRGRTFVFSRRNRDAQGRYKAFGFAQPD